MTKEEAIKILQNIYFEVPEIKESLQIAIETLSQSSLPSNIDKAAEEYSLDVKAKPYENLVREAFKGGATWRDAQIPSLPSNLDEAADCYKDTIRPEDVDDYANGVFYETFTEYQIADAFKAGAEWMAGLKDAQLPSGKAYANGYNLGFENGYNLGFELGYDKGKDETLKDLPRWKKADRDVDAGTIDFAVFHKNDGGDHEDWLSIEATNRLYKDEYYLELADLEKLPKED